MDNIELAEVVRESAAKAQRNLALRREGLLQARVVAREIEGAYGRTPYPTRNTLKLVSRARKLDALAGELLDLL